ncbi:MAG: YncE family protein [Bacteroidales bacterium]
MKKLSFNELIHRAVCFLCPCVMFIACDENINYQEINPDNLKDYRAIVVNEGQFGYGTSSLTLLMPDGKPEQDVFRKTNGRPMGDVAQSMTRIGDNLYVPLNNSRKVEVFDANTFKSIETLSINEDVIPMYVQHLGGDSIAVTDQMWRNSSSKLMIMDINHGKERPVLRRYVSMNGQTFQMTVTENKLFVGGSKLAVFDLGAIDEKSCRYILTDAGETIQTADFSKIVVDKEGLIWALSEFWLYRIDPVTEKVVKTIEVGDLKVNPRISSIDCSPDGETIYFNAHTSVYVINIAHIEKPVKPVISPVVDSRRTIYHMCVSKENTIFMCDVLYGSLSRAVIHEYDPISGKSLNEFKAGIFPHSIYFN